MFFGDDGGIFHGDDVKALCRRTENVVQGKQYSAWGISCGSRGKRRPRGAKIIQDFQATFLERTRKGDKGNELPGNASPWPGGYPGRRRQGFGLPGNSNPWFLGGIFQVDVVRVKETQAIGKYSKKKVEGVGMTLWRKKVLFQREGT